ncbi:hypothetical protein MNV49_001933 [Pseudohyphozyma bogoriensis]|nr:hypothetical protein MNV49_001933 [Pseudohyphozyma bogoriensis]
MVPPLPTPHVAGSLDSRAGPVRTSATKLAVQACVRCHKRKRKCDRTTPTCFSCRDAKAHYLPGALADLEASRARTQWLERIVSTLLPDIDIFSTPTGASVLPNGPSSATQSPASDNGAASLGGHLLTACSNLATNPAEKPDANWSLMTKQILGLGHEDEVEAAEGPGEGEDMDEESTWNAAVPSYEQAVVLAKAYFQNHGVVHPFLKREEFMDDLHAIYHESQDTPTTTQRIKTFRVLLVLAISTFHTEQPSLAPGDKSYAGVLYNRAMLDIDAVLSVIDIDCVQCLSLLAVYVFYRLDNSSVWSVTGLASRLAVGLGLHRRVEEGDAEFLEKRRLTFWSIYTLDRMVSFTFGRPVSIEDRDINIELPTINVQDTSVFGVPTMVFTHHLIEMRKLSCHILQEVCDPGNLLSPAWKQNAVELLEKCKTLLNDFGAPLLGKHKYSRTFRDIADRLIAQFCPRPRPPPSSITDTDAPPTQESALETMSEILVDDPLTSFQWSADPWGFGDMSDGDWSLSWGGEMDFLDLNFGENVW